MYTMLKLLSVLVILVRIFINAKHVVFDDELQQLLNFSVPSVEPFAMSYSHLEAIIASIPEKDNYSGLQIEDAKKLNVEWIKTYMVPHFLKGKFLNKKSAFKVSPLKLCKH